MNVDAKPPIQQPTQMAVRADERLGVLIHLTRDIVAMCVRANQTVIAMNEQIRALDEMQARTDEYIRLFNLRNVGKTR